MKKKELKRQLKWTKDANTRAMTILRAHSQERDILEGEIETLKREAGVLENTITWLREGHTLLREELHDDGNRKTGLQKEVTSSVKTINYLRQERNNWRSMYHKIRDKDGYPVTPKSKWYQLRSWW